MLHLRNRRSGYSMGFLCPQRISVGFACVRCPGQCYVVYLFCYYVFAGDLHMESNILIRPYMAGDETVFSQLIVDVLEEDEYSKRARRIELASSTTAAGFYRQLGYESVDGLSEPDENGVIRMEKRRQIQ